MVVNNTFTYNIDTHAEASQCTGSPLGTLYIDRTKLPVAQHSLKALDHERVVMYHLASLHYSATNIKCVLTIEQNN